MLVKPLPLELNERLAKWKRWSDSIASVDYDGVAWQQAATQFFKKFATDIRATNWHDGAWWQIDADEQTACVAPPHQIEDLAWRFFKRAEGKYGVVLVGTVEG